MKQLLILFLSLLLSSPLWAERLVIGTSPFDPPMEIQTAKNNIFSGFEIDLVNEVCRRIQATCVFEPMSFKEIMEAVAAGKVDLGMDGFFITEERMKHYLFTQPYLQTKAQLLSLRNPQINAATINGKTIGVEKGTVFKELLLKLYGNVNVIEYNNQQEILEALSDRKIDLVMFDFIGATYWVNNSQGGFQLVGPSMPFGFGYGIMAQFNKAALISRINKALDDMENDGTYLAIYSRYF
ncbi:transporter substrate-binding domain-containing protein [Legionella shakespearei]|uniref:Arginine ABC transporter substrate-binding protein n=1 Tax=Legionella shakespearei DSM 23087 TaxID=1122169 RepID=A0A0W0YW51_9GAMM|nr:transporter substrate-binding domain-containing protein [Legionella shakespearei]KTD61074.1 arginine ABC transporter substrate-binding protein [Legionella shakespearei DSM 23087]